MKVKFTVVVSCPFSILSNLQKASSNPNEEMHVEILAFD